MKCGGSCRCRGCQHSAWGSFWFCFVDFACKRGRSLWRHVSVAMLSGTECGPPAGTFRFALCSGGSSGASICVNGMSRFFGKQLLNCEKDGNTAVICGISFHSRRVSKDGRTSNTSPQTVVIKDRSPLVSLEDALHRFHKSFEDLRHVDILVVTRH